MRSALPGPLKTPLTGHVYLMQPPQLTCHVIAVAGGEGRASPEHDVAEAEQNNERPDAAHEDASERWEPEASPDGMENAE